jgi:hypothetical protein
VFSYNRGMTTNANTITIALSSLESLESAVAKLNRRAIKLGFEQVVAEAGKAFLKYFKEATYRTFQEVITSRVEITKEDYNELNGSQHSWTVEAVDITFNDVSHGFEGHRIVGLTENIDGIFTLNTFDESFDLTDERGTCKCDHCGVNRSRNKVFFVAKTDSTDIIRLGSTCVSNYFVKEDVAGNALAKFKFLEDVLNISNGYDEDEQWGEGNSGTTHYDVKALLKWTVFTTAITGYVSVAKSREDETKIATKDAVLSNIFDEKTQLVLTEAQEKQAEELYEWAKEQGESNDYFNTVQQIIEADYCPSRLVGFVVGIFGWWNAANNKRIAKEANKSQHVGVVGERQEFTGVVKSVKSFETPYGTGYLTNVTCGEDTVIYFNQLKPRGTFESAVEGDTVNFFAAVKEHGEFNSVKQTTVSRASKVVITKVA